MAPWGSPDGLNTSLNSSKGAVPSVWSADVITMNRCTNANTPITSNPPMTFFVKVALGIKINNNQKGCGKKVATLNACLISSFVNGNDDIVVLHELRACSMIGIEEDCSDVLEDVG